MIIKRCYVCYAQVGTDICGGYMCSHCGYAPGWESSTKDSSSLKEDKDGKLEKLQTEEAVLRSEEKESLGETVGG